MRILLTGICGLIGSELCRQLHAAGHEITGNDDLSHNCVVPRELPPMQMLPCRVEQIHYLARSTEFDLIIHCASPVGHARLTPSAQIAWQIVSDTQTMLELADHAGARLITFSSSEVLAYHGETDIRAQYSLGKLTSEAMALGHPRVDARVIRPYNVVGRRQRADGGFVMARFRDAVLSGEPLTVFGDGKQQRHFLHVTDFARFVCLLAQKWPEKQLWHVFNPANAISIRDLALMFRPASAILNHVDGREALGNPTWRDSPDRRRDMGEYEASRQLGWKPQIGIREIITDMLAAGVKAAVEATGA
jgi:nucleoside-diphosphate-sugar epimerase